MNSTIPALTATDYLGILNFSREATSVYISRDMMIGFINLEMMKLWKKSSPITGMLLSDAAPEFNPFLPILQQVWDTGESYLARATPAMIDTDGVLVEQFFDFEYRAVVNGDGKTYAIINTATNVTEAIRTGLELEKKKVEGQRLFNELSDSKNHLENLNHILEERNYELGETIKTVDQLNGDLSARNLQIDITNKSLFHSEERFRTMAEGTDVMIALGDARGNAIYFNKAWENTTGRNQRELLDSGWIDLIHSDDRERIMGIYREALAHQQKWQWEFRMPSQSGDYRWLLASGFPQFDQRGTFFGYVSSTIDITERKLVEDRKNEFMGMMSHELKTPLTSMKGYLQVLMQQTYNAGRDSETRVLEKANQQITRMTGMINSFLTLAMLEAGKIKLECEHFNFAGLIDELQAEYSIYLNSHHLIIERPDQVAVYGDWLKLYQVIQNLIGNSIKFSPRSSIINVSVSKHEDSLELIVTDQGPGIPEMEREKIFDRYYRLANVKNKTTSGFGIGLYFCREIIQLHGGSISVDSDGVRGAEFIVILPLDKQFI